MFHHRLDIRLLKRYFEEHHNENLPAFSNKVVIELKNMQNMLNKVTIQEPTFDRVIVVYSMCSFCRRASNDAKRERGIYVKHFRNIPMADMEIVSPEKKNPSLTQWTGFNSLLLLPLSCLHLSAPLKVLKLMYRSLLPFSLGLWTIVLGFISRGTRLSNPRIDISNGIRFQQNMATYQNLITQSMYDKQLDSGRGTLLHLCDDVIQQEVKEVILSFYILMEQGKATREDLDQHCEDLIMDKFGEKCDFDVDDAVQKLEKLGIVAWVRVTLASHID
ncbi:hypothetical protein IFM89_004407 [Coptis chinensis]|uniref:Uncharacterized protein n=1 Tax=Coptis chinensis TaxID=261450 RepID=A0A835IKU8_9MAGN|nr:hypothetical protein IFM89_004407 [Coptis chinensis]